MKKSFLALASFAAIAVGCQVETMTDLPVVDESVVFKAVTESYAPATKTAMDGLDVVWSADDQVAVFQGNEYYDLFKVTSESVGDTEATCTLQEDRDASNNALPYNGAFYPVSKNMEAYDEDGKDLPPPRLSSEAVRPPQEARTASDSEISFSFLLFPLSSAILLRETRDKILADSCKQSYQSLPFALAESLERYRVALLYLFYRLRVYLSAVVGKIRA